MPLTQNRSFRRRTHS